MYDSSTIPGLSLLGALLLFGRRAGAAETRITVRSQSTSTLTTPNGHNGTITSAAASSPASAIVDQQGSLLTITPSELRVSRSVCASWLDPQSHSTIYERCADGKECILVAFPEYSTSSDTSGLVSLVGCGDSTLPPIFTMLPYQHAPSRGCWERGFGCCSSKEPYEIVLTSADESALMYACATGNYGSLPVLGFEWNTATTLTREGPQSADATSSTITAISTGANLTPGSAIYPVSPAPTILPNKTQPAQGASSHGLSGRSKAGIAVGSIIGGGAILAFAAVLLWRYRKRRREQQQPGFSFGGLEKANDDEKGDSRDQTGQATQPIHPGHLVSELDTKNTPEPVSETTGDGKPELADLSEGRTELVGSSPTSVELTGSPIVSPTSDGSESPVLPPDPIGSPRVSSSETVASPQPPLLHILSAEGSMPDVRGSCELPG